MLDSRGYFSGKDLLAKVDSLSRSQCCELIRHALTLYVLLQSDTTVVATRLAIMSALGYFICPVDAIPDVLPVVGYSDDLAVLSVLLTKLEGLISPTIQAEVDALVPDGCC